MVRKPHQATFRFYEELNDFLPAERRKVSFPHAFSGKPSVKDAMESLGVPHTEVDLVIANGNAVSFSYHLKPGDTVSVYPVFESLDISGVTRLRKRPLCPSRGTPRGAVVSAAEARPLRRPKFILDVHLGKLAKHLRLFGFDSLYRNDYEDRAIVNIAERERRIVLTRDRRLLMNRRLLRGYWIRNTDSQEQLKEVLGRFHLHRLIRSFSRCLECNGSICPIGKGSVQERLLPKTRQYYDRFYHCRKCRRVYWNGSHYQRMRRFIDAVTA